MSTSKAKATAVEAVADQGNEVTALATETPTEAVVTADAPQIFVYLGPNLPKGMLKNGAIFNGTRTAVLKHLESVTAVYPDVAQLIVASEKLPEAMARIQNGGNLLASNYMKLQNKIKN